MACLPDSMEAPGLAAGVAVNGPIKRRCSGAFIEKARIPFVCNNLKPITRASVQPPWWNDLLDALGRRSLNARAKYNFSMPLSARSTVLPGADMPAGVGMADTIIGKALWTGLVRQIAATPMRNRDGFEFFPRRAVDADSGNRFHLRVQRQARLKNEVAGEPCVRSSKSSLGKCGRSSRD